MAKRNSLKIDKEALAMIADLNGMRLPTGKEKCVVCGKSRAACRKSLKVR